MEIFYRIRKNMNGIKHMDGNFLSNKKKHEWNKRQIEIHRIKHMCVLFDRREYIFCKTFKHGPQWMTRRNHCATRLSWQDMFWRLARNSKGHFQRPLFRPRGWKVDLLLSRGHPFIKTNPLMYNTWGVVIQTFK